MNLLFKSLSFVKTLALATVGSVTLLTLFTIAGLFLASCGPKGNQPNVEVIQDMMEQPALKAQDFHPHDREKSSMLTPPQGTWPKNVKPYLYWTDAAMAAKKVKNPYANDMSPEFVQLGKRHYQNYCVYCHGETLDGKGPVAEKWKPIVVPSLVSQKIKTLSDGGVFHIITAGQGLMGTYIHQLPEEKDRWAVVNYIRSIQKQTARGQ